MRIWLLGIEPLVERYSAQWARWFPEQLRALGHDVRIVNGDRRSQSIGTGEFLDVYDTHIWKATQLAALACELSAGRVLESDVVLLTDAWSPAVTALAYMRDAGPVRFKLAGLLHAGTYDPHDFLARRGLGRWAADVERGWLAALDIVCVATSFHKELLVAARAADPRKVRVTGFPLYAGEWCAHVVPWSKRERLVVFPHRLAPEKQPWAFDELRHAYVRRYGDDGTRWVTTKGTCVTKADYYSLLGHARVAVSAALQETWGIAMLEALSLGCWPVAPARLSYPETLGGVCPLYRDIDEAVEQVRVRLYAEEPPAYDGSAWECAIGRIAQVLT